MYQSSSINYTEKDFKKLVSVFEESYIKLESNSIELDLSKTYKPNYACLWNKVDNIGKNCKIIQKNDKMCLVVFEDNNKDILSNLYRIEDLTIND